MGLGSVRPAPWNKARGAAGLCWGRLCPQLRWQSLLPRQGPGEAKGRAGPRAQLLVGVLGAPRTQLPEGGSGAGHGLVPKPQLPASRPEGSTPSGLHSCLSCSRVGPGPRPAAHPPFLVRLAGPRSVCGGSLPVRGVPAAVGLFSPQISLTVKCPSVWGHVHLLLQVPSPSHPHTAEARAWLWPPAGRPSRRPRTRMGAGCRPAARAGCESGSPGRNRGASPSRASVGPGAWGPA